jgi:hypothetical protein
MTAYATQASKGTAGSSVVHGYISRIASASSGWSRPSGSRRGRWRRRDSGKPESMEAQMETLGRERRTEALTSRA